MSRRGLLWIAFVLVHVGVAWLGFLLPNAPMGDVYLVYEPWSNDAIGGNGIVGVTLPWVYPAMAIVPMVLAHGFAWLGGGYIVGWAILVSVCNALAFWMLIGSGRSMGRTIAAWFWLAFITLLGPVGMYRIDAITVPIAIAGCLWLFSRPRLAAALFTIGAWIKVWPAALFAAAVIVARRRVSVLTVGLAVTAGVVGVVALAGGMRHVFGFVTEQTGRGLQIEAPVSTFFVWQAVWNPRHAFVYYDPDILTYQVAGPNIDVVIALMTPLLVIAVLAVAALGAFKVMRGGSFGRVMPPLALALVLVFIVFNKVGSPQFQTWMIAPLVFAVVLDRHRAWLTVVVGLLAAGLTQLVYPIMYGEVLRIDPIALLVLSARNLTLVVLLAIAITQLARVPRRARPGSAVRATGRRAEPGVVVPAVSGTPAFADPSVAALADPDATALADPGAPTS